MRSFVKDRVTEENKQKRKKTDLLSF